MNALPAGSLKRLAAALLAALCCTAGAAAAPPLRDTDQEAVRRAVEAGRLKPLKDILSAVQSRYAGRVVDVELERDIGGHPLYQFKLLGEDGTTRELYFDAVDGHDVTRNFDNAQDVKPLAEVLRSLMATYEGRIMEVELERWIDARQVYEVRMLTDDGRLREVVVDARTGKVLEPNSARVVGLGELKPIADVIDAVLVRYPGRVLEVEIEIDSRGRRYYEIELRLDDGRYLEVHVDAITGGLLRAGEMD